MSSGRGQSRKLLDSPLAANASRDVGLERREREEAGGMSSPLRARISGHSSWYFVIAFLPTAQTSRTKFLAAFPNEPLW